MIDRRSFLALLSAAPVGLATAAHAEGDEVELTVALGVDDANFNPTTESVFKLAEQFGYYKKYGVDMQLSTEQNGGVGAEEAMVSGSVDLSGAWYIHAIDFQSKGKKVINLIQLSGAPGERIMCTPKSNVKSGADLKGKNVGVTDLGSGTDELTQFIASKAGVKVDLMIRGVCCLRPGVPGLSENVRVRSLLGRYLEHARVYAFGHAPAGSPQTAQVYIGSADWMSRNLDRRVEVLAPVSDPVHCAGLLDLVAAEWADTRGSWALGPDGVYRKLPGDLSAQEIFMRARGTVADV